MLAIIFQASLAYGLNPHLLHAILWQESRLKVEAVNAGGDTGIGQISPAMIKHYGFNPVALRTDVRYSIYASARVLADVKKRWGKKEPKIWWSRYHSSNLVLRWKYHQAVKRWM